MLKLTVSSLPLVPPTGLLGPGLENVLFDPRFWLGSLEEGDDDIAIGVSVPEETLDLVYRDVLMQEGLLCLGPS